MTPEAKLAVDNNRMASEEAVIHIIGKLNSAVIVFLLATITLIAGIGYSIYNIETVEDRVAVVESSPCVKNASGPACQAILDEAIRARSLQSTCVSFKQVLLPSAYSSITRCKQ